MIVFVSPALPSACLYTELTFFPSSEISTVYFFAAVFPQFSTIFPAVRTLPSSSMIHCGLVPAATIQPVPAMPSEASGGRLSGSAPLALILHRNARFCTGG